MKAHTSQQSAGTNRDSYFSTNPSANHRSVDRLGMRELDELVHDGGLDSQLNAGSFVEPAVALIASKIRTGGRRRIGRTPCTAVAYLTDFTLEKILPRASMLFSLSFLETQ